MNTALEFLKTHRVFHLATVEGAEARVRPFGFVMKRNGALYLCTGKGKDVYRQLVSNPDIEISAMGDADTWLRVRGRIAFDESREAKAQAFAEEPRLLEICPKGADDENFVTFRFTEGRATLYSHTAAPRVIPLV